MCSRKVMAHELSQIARTPPVFYNLYMIYPKPFPEGGTIGIVSSGSATKDPTGLSAGKTRLEALGYRVVVHPQNYLQWKDGQLAGDDVARAEAIMDMFRDPSIGAILSARGGNGSIRLLNLLDYDVIRQNPKPFIGFSDITVLLNAIYRQTGMVTYHGPMLSFNFGNAPDAQTIGDFQNVLSNIGKPVQLNYATQTLAPGEAKGVLLGGNLTMLQSILATPYDWPHDQPTILFFEDVEEVLYRLDRTLQHMKLAGKFKNVVAVLVGEMVNIPDGETSAMRAGERKYGPSFEDILQGIFPHVPIAMNLPFGHGKTMTTLPVGGGAQVNISTGHVKLRT